MDKATMNSFCRRYDMVYVEMGRIGGVDVYWFVDFDNHRRYYTYDEILNKIRLASEPQTA